MDLNAVSILLFDCVSKKTHFDFSESVVTRHNSHNNQGLSFADSCNQTLLRYLGDLSKKVKSVFPSFQIK